MSAPMLLIMTFLALQMTTEVTFASPIGSVARGPGYMGNDVGDPTGPLQFKDHEVASNQVSSRSRRQIDSLGGSLIPGFVKKICSNKYQCFLENVRLLQENRAMKEALQQSDNNRHMQFPDSDYGRWTKRINREARFDRIEQPTGLDF